MKINEIVRLIKGTVLSGSESLENEVKIAFASDLMSDVLTVKIDNLLLLTGLVNLQAIRTAEMSDINCIIFVRNKKVTEEMIRIARENKMIIIQSPYSMFKVSGILYNAGIKPVF
ncbi:MAG: DRTGG domain-containing protein [Bacteroidales bacterium]|nr:DRTGG domain-containing protein [Bacteroidales bacterium]MDD4603886.1 DRTGG domain-containing protein [Bacteroidales bacterium]